MEEPNRLKIKIGPHEFEASGSFESVREQFQAFKEMVAMLSNHKTETNFPPPITQEHYDPEKVAEMAARSPLAVDSGLEQIMRVENRNVSLTARPVDIGNAILALLYGQKILRQNEGVTGAEIISGLRSTGGYAFDRIDRILVNLARSGDVIAFGEHRGKRYRLTNTGIVKARTLAADLILSVGGAL